MKEETLEHFDISYRNSSPQNENVPILRPSKHPSLFLHWNRFAEISITALAHQWILCHVNGCRQLFTSWDITWCSGVVCIIVMLYQLFGLSFWRHPFTAGGLLVSKWCNATFLQISIEMKQTILHFRWIECTFSAKFHFWVNCSFEGTLCNFCNSSSE